MFRLLSLCSLFLFVIILGACSASLKPVLDPETSEISPEAIRIKNYESSTQKDALRGILSTLQDLGFVIDSADADLGAVTGTKMDDYQLTLSLYVTPLGPHENGISVTMSAQYNRTALYDPAPYQQFFSALDRTLAE